MYFGEEVKPSLLNFYAYTIGNKEKKINLIPEWIEAIWPDALDNNRFVVYTKHPMKSFSIKRTDYLIRCGVGRTVFFLIVNEDIFNEYWTKKI